MIYRNPIIIGIAGGSGSGKNSISRIIANKINTNSVTILHEKGYYRNKNQEPVLEQSEHNFDHPKDFDNDLLLQQLKELINGNDVHEPYYSFKTHHRLQETKLKHPAKVIIIEGMLALYDERFRKYMNLKIYVDASADIMLIRRLRQAMKKHLIKQPLDKIFNHYLRTIRPMYKQFVAPTQRYADVIIPEGWKNGIAISAIIAQINDKLKKRENNVSIN